MGIFQRESRLPLSLIFGIIEQNMSGISTATEGNKAHVELLTTGGRFGDFTVEWLLGKGDMGSVYLMRTASGKPVAVKVLRSGAMTHKMRRGLADEAKLLVKRSHKSCISFHDVGIDPASGLCYIVMDYMPGGTLAERIKTHGKFSVGEAVDIAAKIASALETLHARGFVHRDVNPGNIMFMEDGTPVLMDTGIAKFDGGGPSAYMAPEQIAGFRDIDARVDIYSLGFVLWEMLAGRSPADGTTELDLSARAEGKIPIPDIREVRPDVPDSLAKAIAQMCAPKPEMRPATACAAEELLQKAVSNGAILPPGKEKGDSPPPAAAAPRKKAHRRFLVAACVAATCAVAALALCAALLAIFSYAEWKVSKAEKEAAIADTRAAELEQMAIDMEKTLAEMTRKAAESEKKAGLAEARILESKRSEESLKRELQSLKTALRIAEIAVERLSAKDTAPDRAPGNLQEQVSEPPAERQDVSETKDGDGEAQYAENSAAEERLLAGVARPAATAIPQAVDIRLFSRNKQRLGDKIYYEYKGDVTCRIKDGETADITLEAFHLFREPKSSLGSLAADVAQGVKIGSFTFGQDEPDKQKFEFTSLILDKSVAELEKGVLVRAVADGHFLSAASLPNHSKWVKAAEMLSMPENGVAGDTVAENGVADDTVAADDVVVRTVSTNIYLMTEWVFNQSAVGNPQALINDVVKCPGHSTTHIIDYDVVPESGMEVYSSSESPGSGSRGGVNFTMSLGGFRSPDAECTFRCWERECPTFNSAPTQHRASVSGKVSTCADFKISIDTGTGDWKLESFARQDRQSSLRQGHQPWSYTPSGFVIDARGNVSRR